ncbi:MAG: YeeE/YedE thiosulfate transporter family protein, partial [Paracoccaceae bacterium]
MFEDLGFETLTAPQAAILFGLVLGGAFGALAEGTRFCLRRAVVGTDRRHAAGTWLAALAVALAGTQALVSLGYVDFSDHRYLVSDVAVPMIVLGGVMFGAGMVLTRGCVSRLTVLGASGNLRALLVLVVFAVTAHATLKGVLAPVRTALAETTWTLDLSLANVPGAGYALALVALGFALRSGLRWSLLLGGAAIGALVPLG